MHSVLTTLSRMRLPAGAVLGLAIVSAAALLRVSADTIAQVDRGINPQPVKLHRPKDAPLSAVGLLGKQIFYDRSLSGSGAIACASCHSPNHAYGPPDGRSVQPGGPGREALGDRAVPSLRYIYRVANFSIGPDNPAAENVNVPQMAAQNADAQRPEKVVGSSASAVAMVPQGGLFWDGRVNTLQDQAMGPLFNPVEMANKDIAAVAAKLRQAPYANIFAQLFGPQIFATPARLVDEAMFAVARYQIEDPSFHPYSSKYDAWLEGKTELSDAELRGLKLFEDKNKGNCAGCHLDRPSPDGQPPLFTDFQYEALGVPRNRALPDNRNPRFFDLGLCGPLRKDLTAQKQYCAMFRTPSLRNSATRQVFFHNGIYHDLNAVLRFYAFRDVSPEKIYPPGKDGKPRKFDDVPAAFWANLDVTDPPFNRKPGQASAMSTADMQDIIAFLGTLTDGYRAGATAGH